VTQEATLAPLLDEGEVGVPRVERSFTLSGLFDEGELGTPRWVQSWLPDVAFELVEADGSHVAWLDEAHGLAFRRELDGPGSVTATVQHSDPILDDLTWDRRIRVWLRGEVVHAGLIEPREDSTVDQAEEAGQAARVGGRGVLAVLDQGTVDPLRLALQPVQDSVRFNFGHPDFDDAGWIAPKVLRYLDEAYDQGFTVPGPYWGMPLDEWWDLQARVIGPHQASIETAPVGKWYLRKTFSLAEDTTVQFDLASDGPALVFLDGQMLKNTGAPEQGMTDIHTVTVDVSAGSHVIGVEVTNRVWQFTSANPTGFLLTAFDGRPWDGDVVVRTDSTWSMLAYPAQTPGWTAGKILRWLLAAWDARGGPSISTTFTDKVDSKGKAWPVIPDETFQCGRSLLAAVTQLAENHIDVSMAPTGSSLSAWVKGNRGRVRDLTLANLDPVTDGGEIVTDGGEMVYEFVDNPCLTNLRHRTEPPLASRVLARWDGGWISRSIAASWYRELHVQLPSTLTVEQAEQTTDDLLTVFSQERVEFSAGVHPRVDAQRPFDGFTEGDYLNLPDRRMLPTQVRVLTLAASVDRDGVVAYEIEAGDRVQLERERLDAWLRRMQPGAIGGRTEVAQPVRNEREIARRKTPTADATPFSQDGPVTASTSGILRPTGDWLFVRWVADLVSPGTTGTTIAILVNGTPVSSFTIPANERKAEHTTGIWTTPVDTVQVQVTSAGSGAEQLTVTPIYRVG
jgi:hypothetical protein